MCGRFTRRFSWSEIHRLLSLTQTFQFTFAPAYNVAPTQESPILRADPAAQRVLELARWGLVPHWAKDTTIASRLVNARAETILEKPAFRASMQSNRCVVPISGFYEWKKIGDGKQPWYISRADGQPMLLAGLRDDWHGGQSPLTTFAIATTSTNDFMARLHDRMPAILEPEQVAAWLNPATPPDTAAAMLRPAPDGILAGHPVSTLVNNPRNQGEELIREVPATGSDSGLLFG